MCRYLSNFIENIAIFIVVLDVMGSSIVFSLNILWHC
ncbi:hypothetical protein ECH_0053 [Ehrlichia chaffeensis str. Arkansas]|uniref:Uncharacterized protein n=1 Tax=Ehrlichia chaffeensis (strain ATCC CRL-10679 / Arkansas) TaxID=205920 RepID=Q2GI49_EHRCR|nr:hypothetical protein ECH_0053 [Ehrlichia chaffeensis str. Arkansas]